MRFEQGLQCILGVGALVEGVQAGFLDAAAIFGLRLAVGKVVCRALGWLLGHAGGIVNGSIDAMQTQLRVAVVEPCGTRGIGIARVLARFGIARHAIEIAQIRDDAGAVGMLLGALHFADHLLPDRGLCATLGGEFLADGLGGAGSQRTCAPYRDSEIALVAKRVTIGTGELRAFVADWKTDRIAASVFEFSALIEGGLLRGVRLRGLRFGFFRGRSASRNTDE